MESALYEHAFQWSLRLARLDDATFSGSTRLRWDEKIVYKFIVDGKWCTSTQALREWDSSGNENNVFQVPPLALPTIEGKHLSELAKNTASVQDWRSVKIARWNGDSIEIFAALQPSSQLTLPVLRASILPTLADLPAPFALARVPAEGTLQVVEECDGIVAVPEGLYVLVGAEPVLPLTLKPLRKMAPTVVTRAPAPTTLLATEVEENDNLSLPFPSSDSASPPSPVSSSSAASPESPQSTLLTPIALSTFSLPKSRTRYFDFTDSSWSSSFSAGEADAESEFSEVASASFAHSIVKDGKEPDLVLFDDGKSDATFNTALSEGGWAVTDVDVGEEWSLSGREGIGGSSEDADVEVEGDEGEGEEGEEEGEPDATMVVEGGEEDLSRSIALGQTTAAGEDSEVSRPFEVLDAGNSRAIESAWEEGMFVLVEDSQTGRLISVALHTDALPLISSIKSLDLLAPVAPSNLILEEKVVKHTENVSFLPTPPASPQYGVDLELPSLHLPGTASLRTPEHLKQDVQEQLESGMAKWVAVKGA
ncbi:hypothetical protein JCM11641_007036 [Rhodosporidiobolus odoratus]